MQTRLVTILFSLGSFGSLIGAPVFNPLFGGPGPTTATDSLFVLLGNTAFESFGYEFSFNGTQDARFNALDGGGNFVFSISRVDTPTWTSGRRYTFAESYSGDVTKQVSGSVTDTVTATTYTVPTFTASFGGVKSLVVRMVAPDPDLSGGTARPTAGSLSFTNWVLQGQPIAGMPATLTNATANNPSVDDIRLINYFAISGIDFTQAWSLTGEFTMAWSGSTNPGSNANPLPNSNDLAFQIKAYQKDLVESPEPGTILLMGAGCVGIGLAARRNRKG